MLVGMLFMVYLLNINICTIYSKELLIDLYSLEDVYEIKKVLKK
jgi:hypothetical protein